MGKQEAKDWLATAKGDLDAARILANAASPDLSNALYHCQQAAEKAIKGVLIYHNIKWGAGNKGHDIGYLIKLAKQIESSSDSELARREQLTQYATKFRYPNPQPQPAPTRTEFDQVFQNADEFYQFALSILPTNLHPL